MNSLVTGWTTKRPSSSAKLSRVPSFSPYLRRRRLGGLVSSTAVTLTFARRSALAPDFAAPLGVGVVAASTVLLLRVIVLSAILNRLVALALVPLLLPPLVAGLAVVGYWLSRSSAPPNDATPGGDGKSPLGVRSAITMALAFQVTLTAIEVIRSNFGSPGILASAALLGLTDMDALTLAMNRLGQDRSQTALAGLAIGVGVLANALLKLALAVALGGPGFRRVAVTGLLVLAGASALAIWAVAR